MSDISFNLSFFTLLLIFGWPGLLAGAAAGALLWRKRRLLGAAAGALAGLFVWAAAALTVKML